MTRMVPLNLFTHLRTVEQEIERDEDSLDALVQGEAPFERIGSNIYGSFSSSPIATCDSENTARAVLHALRTAAMGES